MKFIKIFNYIILGILMLSVSLIADNNYINNKSIQTNSLKTESNSIKNSITYYQKIETNYLPETLEVTNGTLQDGNVSSLQENDGDLLVINQTEFNGIDNVTIFPYDFENIHYADTRGRLSYVNDLLTNDLEFKDRKITTIFHWNYEALTNETVNLSIRIRFQCAINNPLYLSLYNDSDDWDYIDTISPSSSYQYLNYSFSNFSNYIDENGEIYLKLKINFSFFHFFIDLDYLNLFFNETSISKTEISYKTEFQINKIGYLENINLKYIGNFSSPLSSATIKAYDNEFNDFTFIMSINNQSKLEFEKSNLDIDYINSTNHIELLLEFVDYVNETKSWNVSSDFIEIIGTQYVPVDIPKDNDDNDDDDDNDDEEKEEVIVSLDVSPQLIAIAFLSIVTLSLSYSYINTIKEKGLIKETKWKKGKG